MAETAVSIAGTLKGTKLRGGESFGADIATLTAIALAEQQSGELRDAGWWGMHVGELNVAAYALLAAHQPGSGITGGDPPYQLKAYTSGAYLMYMPQATAAAASAPAINNTVPNPGPDSLNKTGQDINHAASSIASTVSSWADIAVWFGSPHNWLRIVWGVTGVGFVFLGFAMMFHKPIAQAAQAAAVAAV